jgi:hypothetical protein
MKQTMREISRQTEQSYNVLYGFIPETAQGIIIKPGMILVCQDIPIVHIFLML